MIYIGSFLHTTNQEEKDEKNRRHGEFIMVVEADDRATAVQKFTERIMFYRSSADFFQGECAVYLSCLFEFVNAPRGDALMLNYRSYAGDPVMPFIGCSAPSDATEACRIYEWKDNRPEIDGVKEKALLRFSK